MTPKKFTGVRRALLAVFSLTWLGLPASASPADWAKVLQVAQLISTDYVEPVSDVRMEQAAIQGLLHTAGRDDEQQAYVSRVTGDFGAFDRAFAAVGGANGSLGTKLTDGAIRGMVAGLDDPYSRYIDTAAYRHLQEDRSGNFSGVGLQLEKQEQRLTVFSLQPGAPAEHAGVQVGDRVLTVDGLSVEGLSAQEASQHLRGAAGTTVTMRIARGQKMARVSMIRRPITLQPVTERLLPNRIGYVKLTTFKTGKSVVAMRTALTHLKAQGMRALVLDLRQNPGGDVASACSIAAMFLGDSVAAQIVDRDGHKQPLTVHGPMLVDPLLPIAVMIDSRSASAAEILAGSLKDNRQVTLVGERSFGKGCIQLTQGLADGTGIAFTTRMYLTPNGSAIHKVGLSPDVAVAAAPHAGTGSPDIQLLASTTMLASRLDTRQASR